MSEAPGQIGLLTHSEHLFQMGWPFAVQGPTTWGLPSPEVLWDLAVLYRGEDDLRHGKSDDLEDYWVAMEDALGVSLPRGDGSALELQRAQAREAA